MKLNVPLYLFKYEFYYVQYHAVGFVSYSSKNKLLNAGSKKSCETVNYQIVFFGANITNILSGPTFYVALSVMYGTLLYS